MRSPGPGDECNPEKGPQMRRLEVAALPHDSAPDGPEDRFRSFVQEFAHGPEASAMVGRLRVGHDPDRDGWCTHPAHTHRWERYPCFTRRFADLVDAAPRPLREIGQERGADRAEE